MEGSVKGGDLHWRRSSLSEISFGLSWLRTTVSLLVPLSIDWIDDMSFFSTLSRHQVIWLTMSIVIILAVSSISSVHAAEPSFSCARAKTTVEKIICDSEALSELDKKLANTYEPLKEAFVMLGQKNPKDQPNHSAIILEQQRDWIRLRDRRCKASRDIAKCIEIMTQERIAVLGGGTKPTYLAGWFESLDKTSNLVIFPTRTGYIVRVQSVGCDWTARITIDNDGSLRFLSDTGNAVFLLINGSTSRIEPDQDVRSIGFPSEGVRALTLHKCPDGDPLRNRYLRHTPRNL